jgi:hypothetical protein
MSPPRRLGEFDYREFKVVLAQDSGQIRAMARDSKGKQVAEASGRAMDHVKSEIKACLNHLSQDFFGIEGAINLFRQAFPDAFQCEYYHDRERIYKDQTTTFILARLGEGPIDDLLARGEYRAVGILAKQSLNNLVFANEQMALGDALKTARVHQPFAEGFRELLYGDFGAALRQLVNVLGPYKAAKWPILTFWPFFRFPDRHMFLKPTIVKECARRLGYEFDYQPMPNLETYRSLLQVTDLLRKDIAVLQPKDNIDVQSFMHVVAKEGYVRGALRDHEVRATKREELSDEVCPKCQA